MCDLENLKNEEAMTRVGSQRDIKKNLMGLPSYMRSVVGRNVIMRRITVLKTELPLRKDGTSHGATKLHTQPV